MAATFREGSGRPIRSSSCLALQAPVDTRHGIGRLTLRSQTKRVQRSGRLFRASYQADFKLTAPDRIEVQCRAPLVILETSRMDIEKRHLSTLH